MAPANNVASYQRLILFVVCLAIDWLNSGTKMPGDGRPAKFKKVDKSYVAVVNLATCNHFISNYCYNTYSAMYTCVPPNACLYVSAFCCEVQHNQKLYTPSDQVYVVI